jgi:Zn-finger nucleic acid-binding protein
MIVICPVCKAEMMIVEYHDIELDMCAECQGVWFDSGELELMLQTHQAEGIDEFLEEMRNSPDANTDEKKRKCPLCGKKMDKKDVGGIPKVIIDNCRNGHGIWFDGGEVVELSNLFHSGTADHPENPAVEFLEEFFGTPE